MPFIEDWITHPITIINRLQEKSPSTFENDVRNYFQTHIADPQLYKEIPSLNDRDPDRPMPSGCLVRYRAMVQDMADDEIYCTHYTIRSNDHREIEVEKWAKYADLFVCPPGYTVVEQEPSREKFNSRQCFSCINIPNESQWVKEIYAQENGEQPTTPIQKRSIDDHEQLLSPLKRLKTEETDKNSNETATKTEVAKPNVKPYYIVKVYESTEDLLLNSLVEFIGVYYDHSVVKDNFIHPSNEMDHDHISPIKTIHCIQYKKLSHNNPLLFHLPIVDANEITIARQYILSLFNSIFPGDTLLCEYLLLHLLSRIYVRQTSMVYGKLSLNISNISPEQLIALEHLLQTILPLQSRLNLTIESLNTTQLMPNKNVPINDDSEGRLTQTVLQLPFNSHLLIDETNMDCGQLTRLGLNNIKLLQDLLRQQTLKYEFHVYQLDYECDIRCLIISTTKSILPCDIYIRYQEQQQQQQQQIEPLITKEQIDIVRRYLTFVSQQLQLDQTPDGPSSAVNSNIQEDFVTMRKQKILTDLDDFHLLLVLARLETLSYGENSLTQAHWIQAKNLEFTRRHRMNI